MLRSLIHVLHSHSLILQLGRLHESGLFVSWLILTPVWLPITWVEMLVLLEPKLIQIVPSLFVGLSQKLWGSFKDIGLNSLVVFLLLDVVFVGWFSVPNITKIFYFRCIFLLFTWLSIYSNNIFSFVCFYCRLNVLFEQFFSFLLLRDVASIVLAHFDIETTVVVKALNFLIRLPFLADFSLLVSHDNLE